MGIAAIILGAIAVLISLVSFVPVIGPMIGWICYIFGLLALIFGIISLVKGKKVPGIVGIACAIVSSILFNVAPSVDEGLGDFEDALNDPAVQMQMQQGLNEALQQAAQPVPAQPVQPTQ